MFPSFYLFGWEVGTYGIMVVLGGAACTLAGMRLIKRFGLDLYDFLLILIAIGVGAFFGAHILFGITHIRETVYAFRHIATLWFTDFWNYMIYCWGGMVFYGGFLGGLAAIPIYCRFHRELRTSAMLDLYAVLVPLFHVFGRIGCFLGGCCYGIPSDFGFTVHGNTINPDVNDVCRLPVQLIEAGCNLLIFLLLLYLFRRSLMTDRLILIYMLVYPAVRFTLELFRGDEVRGFLFGLSTSQWISLILFVISAFLLAAGAFKRQKQPLP